MFVTINDPDDKSVGLTSVWEGREQLRKKLNPAWQQSQSQQEIVVTTITIDSRSWIIIGFCHLYLLEERLNPWTTLSSEIAFSSGTEPSSSIKFKERLISWNVLTQIILCFESILTDTFAELIPASKTHSSSYHNMQTPGILVVLS